MCLKLRKEEELYCMKTINSSSIWYGGFTLKIWQKIPRFTSNEQTPELFVGIPAVYRSYRYILHTGIPLIPVYRIPEKNPVPFKPT